MKIKKTALLLAALITSMLAVAVHAGAEAVDGAFSALENNGILTLNDASTLDETVTIDGKKVTLDLNGQTLTVKDGGILVDNGAELTITDSAGNGMIDFAGKPIVVDEYELDAGGWIYADHGSTVIMEKGKILTTGDITWADVSNSLNEGTLCAILVSNSSAITVNDGEIELACTTNDCYAAAIAAVNSSTVNYNNGKTYFSSLISDYRTFGIAAIASTININGGSVDVSEIAASVLEGGTMNITGGTITANIAIIIGYAQVTIDENAVVNGDISFYFDGSHNSVLNIRSGVINGKFLGENSGKSDITISGGVFSAEPDASYLAEGLTAEYIDGAYVIKDTGITVSTKNTYSADGANETTATGFITTISGGALKINTIKWTVTYAEESRYTEFTPENAISIDGAGDAKIGLIVNGFNTSDAIAVATINGIYAEKPDIQ